MPEDSVELGKRLAELSQRSNDQTQVMLDLILEHEKKSPQDHMSHVYKGWVYTMLGKYNRARQSLEHALNLNPKSAWAHFRKGEVYQMEGEHAHALECFIKAVKLKPHRADFWLEKAAEEDELHLLDQAMHSYEKAMKLGDKSGWAWYGTARIQYVQGRKQEAIESARKASADNPTEETFRRLEQDIKRQS